MAFLNQDVVTAALCSETNSPCSPLYSVSTTESKTQLLEVRNTVLTPLFVFHIAHRKAVGKRSVHYKPLQYSASIKIVAGNMKEIFLSRTKNFSRKKWRERAEKMHITQQMTSINLDFQVAAAALSKKKIYL